MYIEHYQKNTNVKTINRQHRHSHHPTTASTNKGCNLRCHVAVDVREALVHLRGVLAAAARARHAQGHKHQTAGRNAGERLQHGVGDVLAQDFHGALGKLVCGLQLELCYGADGQRGRVALQILSVPLGAAQLQENAHIH